MSTFTMPKIDETAASRMSNILPEYKMESLQKKFQVEGTILTAKPVDGFHGCTTHVVIQTETGNLVEWWASGYKNFTLGVKALMVGTIKARREYNGKRLTTLTRATVVVA